MFTRVAVAARLYVDYPVDRLKAPAMTVGAPVRRLTRSKNYEIVRIRFEPLHGIVGPSAKWVDYGSAAFEDFVRMREVIVP